MPCYWWKKYPCTEYELVKMAIGDIPLVNNTSAMTDITLYNYGNISDGKYTFDNSGTVMDGVLYVSDESVLNSFNKSSRQGVSPYRRYSPQAVWLIWLNSRADSYSLDGRRFVFDILFFRYISRRFINVRSFCISQKVLIYKNILS